MSTIFKNRSFAPGIRDGFNHLLEATLAADPILAGRHLIAFLLRDGKDATVTVETLANNAR